MTRYYSTGQAAKKLGIKVRRLQTWIKNGQVECEQWPSGRYAFTDEHIAALTRKIQPAQHHPEVETPNPLHDPTRPRKVVPLHRHPAA